MFPDTEEKRRAGMAAFRAQMLAAHLRRANDPRLTKKQRADQQFLADQILATQAKA